MKSWRKLRSLVKNTSQSKVTNSHVEHSEDLEEILKGMQKVYEMRLCYEKLHSASSLVANCAYGFSQAIQEMGACLMNDFSSTDDAESSNIREMVGHMQLEISKILEHYARHVSETLTMPTESLLNEIKVINEKKNQYDEKRNIYHTLRLGVAKGRSKSKKDEPRISQKLEEAKEQFDELCMLIGCRLLSLEEGHPRNLLSQVASYYASQMHLFRNGLACLREIEARVKQIVKARHLDEHLCFRDGTFRTWDHDSGLKIGSTCGEDSSSHSSLEQVTYVSKELLESPCQINQLFSCGNPAGTKTVPISPTRLPNMDGSEKVHGQTKHSVSTSTAKSSCTTSDVLRASPPTSFPPSTNMAISSASEKMEASTYHCHLQLLAKDKHKYHASLQLPSMQHSIESEASPDRTAAEDIPSHPGTELWIESQPVLSPEPSSNVPTHVRQLKGKKKFSSFKFDTSFLSPSSRSRTSDEKSSQLPILSTKLSRQETFMSRNGHTRGEVCVPNSGPLPRHPADMEIYHPIYKSGPLHWSNGASYSPEISPPNASQLHKLPPPPLCPVSKNLTISNRVLYSEPLHRGGYHEPFIAGSKIASPLPPPPLDTIKKNVCVNNCKLRKPVHLRSPTCPEVLLTGDNLGNFHTCSSTEANNFVHVAGGSS